MGKARAGRTTRMIEHARLLSDQGRKVVVIVNGPAEVAWVSGMLYGYPKVLVGMENEYDINWIKLKIRNESDETILLIDHQVIRRRFRAVLEMYTRYSKNPPE